MSSGEDIEPSGLGQLGFYLQRTWEKTFTFLTLSIPWNPREGIIDLLKYLLL